MSCCLFSARRSRSLAGRFPATWPTRATKLQAWQHFINPDHLPQGVREAIDRTFARTVDAAGDSLSHGFGGLLPLLGYLPWFILIPVVAFFLLKDGAAFRRNILLTLPRGRLRGRGAELFEDINDALAAYMRAALLACLLVGVLCTIGFVLIGVPYALLFGVVAGLLEFIPLVGPLAVAVGATLVASFHSINQAMWCSSFLGALRLAQDYVVFPRLVRRGIHMHPLGVILAILSGAELARHGWYLSRHPGRRRVVGHAPTLARVPREWRSGVRAVEPHAIRRRRGAHDVGSPGDSDSPPSNRYPPAPEPHRTAVTP